MKPKVFIGSSVEGLSVAYSMQQNLSLDAEITVWDQGVFELSKTTIESLLDILSKSDFGIFVFSPDDILTMRKQTKNVIRDNVLFEFGLFIGKLSRERVFFVIPSNMDFHLPTDLIGITPGKYDPNREDNSLQAATGPVCHQIRLQIKKIGCLFGNEETSSEPETQEIKTEESVWYTMFIENNYSKALDTLEKQIESDTDDVAIVDKKVWIAYCKFKINTSSGIKELEDTLEECYEHITAHIGIARIFSWDDYNQKAIFILEKAISKFGDNESLIITLATCYKKHDSDEKALELLISKSADNNISIALEIVDIYEKQKEFEKARKIIHSIYLNYPKDEIVRYTYAKIAIELSINEIAIFFLSSLTSEFPENISYWGYLSNSCLSLNLYDLSMIACKRANELADEKQDWIILNIGNMLKNRGFYSEAITYLEQGLLLNKNSEYGHDRLAGAIKLKEEEKERSRTIGEQGRKLLREYITLEITNT